MTDRQWTDTDLALILPHMHAPDVDDDTDRQERAAAVLDALTAAGWRPAVQPGRWELPPEPAQTEVWDRLGIRWSRDPSDPGWLWWADSPDMLRPRHWHGLLARGPLSAAPPETAGGEHA